MELEKGCTRLILETCRERGLLPNQTAYVLATAQWETAHTMQPVVEAFWLSEAWRKRNLRYYPWHGRGFVQLTWERNYRRASEELGVDLIANPDLALDPKIAADVLVVGMMDGWFGKALPRYVNAEKTDFIGARRSVNGLDKAQQIADLAGEYLDALTEMEHGNEKHLGV